MTEFISIRGARENNLKDVTLQIPKRKLTIFTGVSGSGKSSIVFDTMATEAQRQLYENFSLFVRNFLPKYPQPDADAIENLTMAVIVDQKRLGGGSHSTVGTVTDIYTRAAPAVLARGQAVGGRRDRVFVQRSARRVSRVRRPREEGRRGLRRFPRHEQVAQRRRRAGAVLRRMGSAGVHAQRLLRQRQEAQQVHEGRDGAAAPRQGSQVQGEVRRAAPSTSPTPASSRSIERSYIRRDIKTLSERTQKAVMPYLKPRECPSCKGARLSPAALASKINGHNIAELSAMEVGELLEVVRAIKSPRPAPIVHALVERLQTRRRHRARVPEPQPRNRHAVRRRIAARADGEAPRQQPRGRDVHLRRAERRPAPARRASPQRAAAEAARQGQHRHRRRTRPRRDRSRRSHRRRRAGRGQRRRHDRVRRHDTRSCSSPTRSPAAISSRRCRSRRTCASPPASCASRTHARTT